MAAKAVAERGHSVTVYEKGPLRREKPCGGAVAGRVKREFDLDPHDKFWDRVFTGLFLCSPQGKTVTLQGEESRGFLVMREKFDHYLVEKAHKAGAHFVENTHVEPFIKKGKVTGVRTKGETIESDIVIACDGTPSLFARKLGIYTGKDESQAATYQYQMKMDEKEIDERMGNNLGLYFGHRWMPYGYCWIFPKKGGVTVGCGTWLNHVRKHRINVKECLDRFVREHPVASEKLENAEILYPQSAMIGFTGVVHPLYLDNFMIAGDAAGFVSLPTGEGIYYSMVSGKIAGEVAAEALDRKDCSHRFLQEYEKRTDKKMGADMKWGPWLRRLALDKESDQENIVRVSREDGWFAKRILALIVGDCGYDRFLVDLLLRPDKLLTFFVG